VDSELLAKLGGRAIGVPVQRPGEVGVAREPEVGGESREGVLALRQAVKRSADAQFDAALSDSASGRAGERPTEVMSGDRQLRGELRQSQRWIGGQGLARRGNEPLLRCSQSPTRKVPGSTVRDLRDLRRDLERELGSLIALVGSEHSPVQDGERRREGQLPMMRALLPEQVGHGSGIESNDGAIVPPTAGWANRSSRPGRCRYAVDGQRPPDARRPSGQSSLAGRVPRR
jgi:hypothetical protein